MQKIPSLGMRRFTTFVVVAGLLSFMAVPLAQAAVTRSQALFFTLNYAKRNCAANRSCRKYSASSCIRKDDGQRCLAWNYDRNRRKGKYTLKRVILWKGRLNPVFLTKWNSYEGWALGPSLRYAIVR